MLENYCDIIAIYCIILNYHEIIAIIEKSIIAQGWPGHRILELHHSLQVWSLPRSPTLSSKGQVLHVGCQPSRLPNRVVDGVDGEHQILIRELLIF